MGGGEIIIETTKKLYYLQFQNVVAMSLSFMSTLVAISRSLFLVVRDFCEPMT